VEYGAPTVGRFWAVENHVHKRPRETTPAELRLPERDITKLAVLEDAVYELRRAAEMCVLSPKLTVNKATVLEARVVRERGDIEPAMIPLRGAVEAAPPTAFTKVLPVVVSRRFTDPFKYLPSEPCVLSAHSCTSNVVHQLRAALARPWRVTGYVEGRQSRDRFNGQMRCNCRRQSRDRADPAAACAC